MKQSQVVKENTCIDPSTVSITKKISNKKRNRSETTSSTSPVQPTVNKKQCPTPVASELPLFPTSLLTMTTKNDDHVFRKPFDRYDPLPPVTIEQLLGLRGDIPDVHQWPIDQLNEFFQQQGFEYASSLLYQYEIDGNQLYKLKREDVFRLSPLKVGKTLKLWNVIEQIQQRNNRKS